MIESIAALITAVINASESTHRVPCPSHASPSLRSDENWTSQYKQESKPFRSLTHNVLVPPAFICRIPTTNSAQLCAFQTGGDAECIFTLF